MSDMIAVKETNRKEEYPTTWRAGVKPTYQPETQSSIGLDNVVYIQLKGDKSV